MLGPLVVAGSLAVGATVAPSAGAATAWTASGPYRFTVDADGTAGAPHFTYDKPNPNPADPTLPPNPDPTLYRYDFAAQTWTFATTAGPAAGTFAVPYTYTGDHAFFQVTVSLVAFVVHAGQTTGVPLVADGPTDCCTPPSGGFSYSGSHDFAVQPGDTYGFTLGGRNADVNNYLRGALALGPITFVPSAPYQDAAIIAQNTSWPNAIDLTSAAIPATAYIVDQPGEARWFKFPVVPDSQVQVDLGGLAQNFDLALYRDIGQTFTALSSTADLTHLSAEFAGDTFSPSIYSPSIYSPSIYSPSIYSPSIYSPSIYSPSIYSPSIYSPSIYSPSIYSPSIYSPSIYSPSIYSPSIYSPSIYSPSIYSPSIYSPSTAFVQAFSSAQTRALIGVSANDGTSPESLHAPTWNNTGFYYVRVQGRDAAASTTPFVLTRTVAGGPCAATPLDAHTTDPSIAGTPGSAQTVILTDRTRFGAQNLAPLTQKLDALRARTGGVVVDVSASTRIQRLNAQADPAASCPYAKTLVAQAIRDVVNTFRDGNGTLKYVVIIGGDSVIPFFRYADDAGLGPESDFVPPVADTSASQASLRWNNVLGQDAYGAQTDLDLKGGVLPVPDLAVGRLVETPDEIGGMIDDYLALTNGTLPRPQRSLVTGYDFLTGAADSVEADFVAGMAPTTVHDQLITNQGVPTSTVTGPSGPSRTTSWTATDLSNVLLGSHHDLVFLAGHFSGNSALAADYTTSIVTDQLAARPGVLTDALVFSAGCHSAYNIVDGDGVTGVTNPLDWAQAMARQRATFIGGTGYQYADTDFVAYSALLYAGFAAQLRSGTAGTPVAVGAALVQAKRNYLSAHATLSGLDRKSLLEATLFGLPMTGVDLPGRAQAPVTPAPIATSPVLAGTPGAVLGLTSATLDVATPATVKQKVVLDVAGVATGAQFRWLAGRDGNQTAPALPALPLQIDDVTSASNEVLRGVGFVDGDYTDTAGVTPLTGAPTIEQNNIHTSFVSPAFFPQKVWAVNYFGALGGSGGDGRTRLAITPAQYRSDPGSSTTDTERQYSRLGLRLYYSSNTASYGANVPALAAPPSIGAVVGKVSADGNSIVVSAHVTGDPSAGIQQAWVTYTAERGAFHNHWASVDLRQDATDSTLWTGTIALPAGQGAADVRFLVQAVNGVGLVGLDTNLGDGYAPRGAVVVTAAPDRAANTAGWYNAPVTVTWSATEPDAPATLVAAPAPTSVAGEGAFQTVTSGPACDAAGSCGTGRALVSIDVTAPLVTSTLAPSANANGWNNGAVTVTFSCTDRLSGIVPGSCAAPVRLTNEGNNQVVPGTGLDAADNRGNASTIVRIDKTSPTVAAPSFEPLAAGSTTSVTVAATDALSGLAGGEYFVGNDPGIGRGTPLALAPAGLTAPIGAALVPGVYSVGVRSQDRAGNWSTAATGYLVVYDPTGGFAIGAGWINSPAGALRAQPTVTGRAIFGFDVRNRKGSTVPVGVAAFDFKAGRLTFVSTAFQSFLVSGSQAQFKGTGKVNGASGFDVLVTLVDGRIVSATAPDKIRIKITEHATGKVLYDTNPGAVDAAPPTLAIAGGNLVIRR